jgi:hypothetical protein
MSWRRAAMAVLLLSALLAAPAGAHELQPGYLELRQTDPNTFAMLWKLPAREDLKGIHPILPADCTVVGETSVSQTAQGYVEEQTIRCPKGLYGESISIPPEQAALVDVMVRVVRLDGSTQVVRLTPLSTSVIIEAAPDRMQLIGTYMWMGIQHILMGVDHLLFVLGLLLIVGNRWMLTKTITSFTIAHSITLAVATLGYASAPALPLNAAIALSILFLGPEIVRKERGETSLTIQHPWIVAFAFGLLHGFGFASGLSALGLSGSEIPIALLLFNVGVEIGQLFFVAVILGLEWSFHVLKMHWPKWVQQLPGYTVGGLGAYWTIQRTILLFRGL